MGSKNLLQLFSKFGWFFESRPFLVANWPVLGHFAAKSGRHFRNRPNFEKSYFSFFAPIWSVSGPNFSSIGHSYQKKSNKREMPVFAFLSSGTHFWQKLAYFSSIFLKIQKNSHILWFFMVQYLEIHEKTPPNIFKSHLEWKYLRFWLILSIIFVLENTRKKGDFRHTEPYSNANNLS